METNKKVKTFDAVKMMRDIRNKISQETENMTFEQLKEYIKAKLKENNAKLVGQKQKPESITSPTYKQGLRASKDRKVVKLKVQFFV